VRAKRRRVTQKNHPKQGAFVVPLRPPLTESERHALLGRLDAEITKENEHDHAQSGHEGASRLPSDIPKWYEEDTQVAPLSPPQAQLASDVEVDVCLAEAIWTNRPQLDHRIMHWMAGYVLLGVVDTSSWRLALRPSISKLTLSQTHFVGRPESAQTMPDGFRPSCLQDIFWRFALFGERALQYLPPRFLTDRLYLRQMPAVSPGLVVSRHRHIMRLLAQGPWHFNALQSELVANRDDLLRDLLALYLTRAVISEDKPSDSGGLASFWNLIRKP
jgi:hypothetical protein